MYYDTRHEAHELILYETETVGVRVVEGFVFLEHDSTGIGLPDTPENRQAQIDKAKATFKKN